MTAVRMTSSLIRAAAEAVAEALVAFSQQLLQQRQVRQRQQQ